jgi:hypothetical protein
LRAAALFAEDEEHKRAKLAGKWALLNDLKPRAELAVKSGALVLLLGGDARRALHC